MKTLKTIILVGIILMMLGCSNTKSDSSAPVDSEKAAADNSAKQVSATSNNLKDIVGLMPRYTADYDITSSGQTQKMTMFLAPPKYATLITTQYGEVRSIFDGSSFVSCTSMQGAWQCFKMESETPQNLDTENSIKSGEAKTTYLGTCSKAGESGSSYEIEQAGEKSTVCYTKEGILLEIKSRDTLMTATKISRSVSDSEFTPPATPKDISSIGVPG